MAEYLAPVLEGADIADTIEANGLDLAYEQFGYSNDPALVLIMGLGMQLTGWPDAFCRALADTGLRVIRFDNRDAGLSTKMRSSRRYNSPPTAFFKALRGRKIDTPYRLEDMAADVAALIDALKIPRAHLVGASMGGMIAQLAAAQYPERVATLGSIMSSSSARRLPRARLRVLLRLASTPRRRDPQSVAAHMARTMRVIGSPNPAYQRSEADWYAECLKSARRGYYPAGTKRQTLAALAATPRQALLGGIHQPSLVIHGAADPLLPVAHGRDTARHLPNCHYEEIPGMGHDLPPRLLPRFVRLIRGLVDDQLPMATGAAESKRRGRRGPSQS